MRFQIYFYELRKQNKNCQTDFETGLRISDDKNAGRRTENRNRQRLEPPNDRRSARNCNRRIKRGTYCRTVESYCILRFNFSC